MNVADGNAVVTSTRNYIFAFWCSDPKIPLPESRRSCLKSAEI